ncbi:MAG: cupin domain-containing protein [Dehalococcoidia bacterium]
MSRGLTARSLRKNPFDWSVRTIFEAIKLSDVPDVTAPDGSDIRLMDLAMSGASMVHCSIEPGGVTRTVRHKTVEETWLCISGTGRLWRSDSGIEDTLELMPGIGVSIHTGTRFQFRNDGTTNLEIVIVTIPPWPGDHEAVMSEGKWEPSI